MSNIDDLVYYNTILYDNLIFESDFDFDLFLEMNKAETVFRTKRSISDHSRKSLLGDNIRAVDGSIKLTPELTNKILDGISKESKTGKTDPLIDKLFRGNRSPEQIVARQKRDNERKKFNQRQNESRSKRQEIMDLLKYATSNKDNNSEINKAYSNYRKNNEDYSKAKAEYEKSSKDDVAKKKFDEFKTQYNQQKSSFFDFLRQQQSKQNPNISKPEKSSQPIVSKSDLYKIRRLIQFEVKQRNKNGQEKQKLEDFLEKSKDPEFAKKITPDFIKRINQFIINRQNQAKLEFEKQTKNTLSKDNPKYKEIEKELGNLSADNEKYVQYSKEITKYAKDDPRYKILQKRLIDLYHSRKKYKDLHTQLYGLSKDDPKYKEAQKILSQKLSYIKTLGNEQQKQQEPEISARSLARREVANIEKETNPFLNIFLNNIQNSKEPQYIKLRQQLKDGTVDINTLLQHYDKTRSYSHNGLIAYPAKAMFKAFTGLPYAFPGPAGYVLPDIVSLFNGLNSGIYQYRRNRKLSKLSKAIGNNIQLPIGDEITSYPNTVDSAIYQYLTKIKGTNNNKLALILKGVNANRPGQKPITIHDVKQHMAHNVLSKLSNRQLDIDSVDANPNFIGPIQRTKLNTNPNMRDQFITTDMVPPITDIIKNLQIRNVQRSQEIPPESKKIIIDNIERKHKAFVNSYKENPNKHPWFTRPIHLLNSTLGFWDRRDNKIEEPVAGFVNKYINNGFNGAQTLAPGITSLQLGRSPEENLEQSKLIHQQSLNSAVDTFKQSLDAAKQELNPILTPIGQIADTFKYNGEKFINDTGQKITSFTEPVRQKLTDITDPIYKTLASGSQSISNILNTPMNGIHFIGNKTRMLMNNFNGFMPWNR